MSWKILQKSASHIFHKNIPFKRSLTSNSIHYTLHCLSYKQHNPVNYCIYVAFPHHYARSVHTEQTTNTTKIVQSLPPKLPPNIPNFASSANSQLKDTISQFEKSFNIKGQTNEDIDQQKIAKTTPPTKPGLLQKVKTECLYYYHGFKLFFYEVKISFRLFKKTLAGHSLSRREKRQFRKTLADIFRLVPFSIFIIVPFLEFLLPVAIKLFPGLLPSTFQTIKTRDDKRKAELKVKLQMSKFLQSTITEMTNSTESKDSPLIHEFTNFFHNLRQSGKKPSPDEIIRFSKLFRDELTLDNMTHAQLRALCKLLMLNSMGISALLRLQLQLCLRHLKADDIMIRSEGVDNMTVQELQSACQHRGMRGVGLSEEKLKDQLYLWLDLHLDKKVPSSLLLLTQAMSLQEMIPSTDNLKAALSSLSEDIIQEAEAEVSKAPKIKLDSLKKEEAKIHEEELQAELQENEKVKDGELVMTDATELLTSVNTSQTQTKQTTPALEDQTLAEDTKSLSQEDIQTLSEVIDKLDNLKECVEEIKTEMQVTSDTEEALSSTPIADKPISTESEEKPIVPEKLRKAQTRLTKKVNNLISDLEKQVGNLEPTALSSDSVCTSDLIGTLLTLKQEMPSEKLQTIVKAIDTDSDGIVSKDSLKKVIKMIASEKTDISTLHIKLITQLIEQEELSYRIEMVDKETSCKI